MTGESVSILHGAREYGEHTVFCPDVLVGLIVGIFKWVYGVDHMPCI